MNFQLHGLDKSIFAKYFDMTAAELEAHAAYLFEADECPCYPCRVSLTDAQVGETVLALSYTHHDAEGPYHSSGPIFIRKNAVAANLKVNEIPDMLKHRQLSLRGYSSESLMIEADTVSGKDLRAALANQLENSSVQYLHIHNAGPGCFNCAVTRS